MTCAWVSECVNIVTAIIFHPRHSRPCEPMFTFGFAMRQYNRGIYFASGLG